MAGPGEEGSARLWDRVSRNVSGRAVSGKGTPPPARRKRIHAGVCPHWQCWATCSMLCLNCRPPGKGRMQA